MMCDLGHSDHNCQLVCDSILYAWFVRWITELAVTNLRVVYKRGFITRHTAEMNMDKVESVDVDQSILGRILAAALFTSTDGPGDRTLASYCRATGNQERDHCEVGRHGPASMTEAWSAGRRLTKKVTILDE
jgi:uncharacterized membrane protein YdbT with pleckstrin-like domain